MCICLRSVSPPCSMKRRTLLCPLLLPRSQLGACYRQVHSDVWAEGDLPGCEPLARIRLNIHENWRSLSQAPVRAGFAFSVWTRQRLWQVRNWPLTLCRFWVALQHWSERNTPHPSPRQRSVSDSSYQCKPPFSPRLLFISTSHTHTHTHTHIKHRCVWLKHAASCFPGLQRSSLWLLFLHTLVWLQNCALTEQPAGLWSHIWTRRWHQTVKVPKSVGFPQGHHRCTPWLSWHPLFTEITEMFRVLLGGFWGRVECKTNFNTGRIDCSPGSLSQCLDGTELVLL